MRRRKHSALSTTTTASTAGSSVASGMGSSGGNGSVSMPYPSGAAAAAALNLEHTGSDAGSSAGSSSIIADADSMRPLAPPARKRRRTIIDAFSSINLNHRASGCHNNFAGRTARGSGGETGEESEGIGGDDADSSQAVVEHEDDITTSSFGDDYMDQGDIDDADRFLLLSDKEEAERKVMFELVFGPLAGRPPFEEPAKKNPVDFQIDKLLLRDARRLQQQQQQQPATQDDTKIHPPYARPMSMMSPMTTSTDATSASFSSGVNGSLTRSNSLPYIWFPNSSSQPQNIADCEMKASSNAKGNINTSSNDNGMEE
mmetsp:Transcript_11657/g.32265  ORF Transcript_11657/g.32265 Transcript_11657/m.32265 type:complete len:315 (-) Transcript_11657:474-1418(-)|eukprot:CAMPEP_0168743006 /NCGR_PEP_ID=MMETSP0724-20121128/13335_1 /TAXON_ID=265536 /ORGANISM="Amphiprora sp., Strain CCMP467" /LENGTH=314 /DNA_ID=CAMNT_0008790585 /DNA_START=396 /DNA_END=1340 /DNA_ORIENTATION=-